jgi:NFU1 iron-sulfur cluster scaffold homolog, mitochondrial
MTELKITAEPQNDPQTCNFIVDQETSNGPSLRFHSSEEAKGSPLAEAIFNTGNVSTLMISSKTITVTQANSEDWRTMGKRIGGAIREAYTSGKALLNKAVQDKIPPSDKIKKLVEEVFETEVNPAVASHGGFIQLVDIKQNDIYIKMGGGCQGCASSTATLRRGVEQTLRRHIPGLGFIFDATDHASGDNPYYQ